MIWTTSRSVLELDNGVTLGDDDLSQVYAMTIGQSLPDSEQPGQRGTSIYILSCYDGLYYVTAYDLETGACRQDTPSADVVDPNGRRK